MKKSKKFFEIKEFEEDIKLIGLATEVALITKEKSRTEEHEETLDRKIGRYEVSEEKLVQLLESEKYVGDIIENKEISNCKVFNIRNVPGSIMDDQLGRARMKLDKYVFSLLREAKLTEGLNKFKASGHFMYEDFTYMGWHTNSRTPGWRLYINVVESVGKSFIRFRDPSSGDVETLVDNKIVKVRMFEITNDDPLWHSVYSDTIRYSFGYLLDYKV